MKVFVISLPDSRKRRLSAIDKVQMSGLPFEIVDGVEASKMRPEILPVRNGVWKRKLVTGEVGCYAAHLRALQRIVDYGLDWGYVLEDDFCYVDNPSYGLVQIADVLPEEFDYITIFKTLGINEKHNRTEDAGPFWRVCETEYLATGYLVHRRFARLVLHNYATCEMPIDNLYSLLSHHTHCFETKDPIIEIAPGFGSDIHDIE